MFYGQITLKQMVKTRIRLPICISFSEFILLSSIHRYSWNHQLQNVNVVIVFDTQVGFIY